MKTLLIADDNEQILDVLKEYAHKDGYRVYTAKTGAEALKEFSKREFSAILLDVMMPEMDGFEVCRRIRRESMVPVIMITARGEDFERIMGLDIGADDYVVKPFSGNEVMARVRAVLRRIDCPGQTAEQKYLVYDNLRVCLETADVTIGGQKITLTKKELEILWTLLDNRGKIFSRENLLSGLWGYDYFGDNRTVDSHMKRLRAKLDKVPHPNWQIKTIWGMGYKFEGTES